MRFPSRPFIAPLLVVLALLCGSCAGSHGRRSCPEGDKCIEVGNGSEPFTIDPSKVTLIAEWNILYDMLVGLTALDASGHPVPGMATSWTTSPDGLTWTFKLRKANWSDGVPVTAEDFVTAFRRVEDPAIASSYANLFYLFKGAKEVNSGKAPPETIGVRAFDPQTLVIDLVHPVPYLPDLLTNPTALPLPTHAIAKWGDRWVDPGHYVSNGAYTLASWKLGERLVLRKNSRFYDSASVCFDQVSYYPMTDMVSGERQVRSGQLDMLNYFEESRVGYLRKSMPDYVHVDPILSIKFIPFNLELLALRDRRVRLAMSMAIDREFITAKISHGLSVPLYGFIPPGLAGYRQIAPPAWASWPFERRIVAARALMRQAGYTADHPLSLELKYSSADDRTLPAALQSDWRRIGAAISLAPTEEQIFYSEMGARDFQIGVVGWILDYPDPLSNLDALAVKNPQQNYPGYDNTVYRGLLARAAAEREGTKRLSALRQAEEMAMDDWPIAPISSRSSRILLNPAITGFVPNAANFHLKRYMCRKGPQ